MGTHRLTNGHEPTDGEIEHGVTEYEPDEQAKSSRPSGRACRPSSW